ncbi:hypothetical protein EOD39_14344 [Acipenser ruthenus]|uniref:Uncharacterized protein n=1 Tax=Acipenser ruthenus TaxID=7906 RepID=A0A662YL60_ACIRT|nr:hypothetical protein EOD39_14344 [Acipenser ruthenus]
MPCTTRERVPYATASERLHSAASESSSHHQEETVLRYQRESTLRCQSPRERAQRHQNPKERVQRPRPRIKLHHPRECPAPWLQHLALAKQQPGFRIAVGAVLASLCPAVWRGAVVPGGTAIQDWHRGLGLVAALEPREVAQPLKWSSHCVALKRAARTRPLLSSALATKQAATPGPGQCFLGWEAFEWGQCNFCV